MIAGSELPADKVTKAFEDKGCRRVSAQPFIGDNEIPHSIWVTPSGHKFMAPDSGVPFWIIGDIIEREVDNIKPH